MKPLRNVCKLPKWAQSHIKELERRVAHAEATLPWTQPGMKWFTLFTPGTQQVDREPINIFTCSDRGTHLICTLNKKDFVFVGRGK